MNCEPHPKSSSPHRPKVGETWEAKGQQGKIQFRVEHATPWTVEGEHRYEKRRVVAGRSTLLRRVAR